MSVDETSIAPRLAVLGLGYVGLPLAVAFGQRYPTLGFDIDAGTAAQGGRLFGRQAFTGISSQYGRVTLGRQNNILYDILINYDAMAVSPRYSIFTMDAMTAGRYDNTAKYVGKFGGFTVTGLYSFARGTSLSGGAVAGGGSQSDAAMQILADVFGLPAQRSHTHETSGLGAAINAAVGLGWHPDHTAAARAMVHDGARFEPDPRVSCRYDRLYNEVYRGLYPALAPTFRRIAGQYADTGFRGAADNWD